MAIGVLEDELSIDLLDPENFTAVDLGSIATPSNWDDLSDLRETFLPVASIYIDCAPCACLIVTAFQICKTTGKRVATFFNFSIRPDDHLSLSCCFNTDRCFGLASLVDIIKTYEISGD